MSLLRVPIILEAPRRKVEVTAIVDTGASVTVIPRSIADRLGLKVTKVVPVRLANGKSQKMGYGSVFVRLNGRGVPCTAIIAPGGDVLLGAETLELMNVSVDPRRGKLKFGRPVALMAA